MRMIDFPYRTLSLCLTRLVGFAILCGMVVACAAHSSSTDTPTITILSSAPERVSGGDALVSISAPGNMADVLRVTLNGRDVTDKFKPTSRVNERIGLVDGLIEGENELAAVQGNSRAATLTLTNYPITGPIFSGPQVQPYICQTEKFLLPDDSYLVLPLDKNCSAPTKVIYLYKSTKTGRFQPLAEGRSAPDDVATVTTLDGKTARYIVRFEAGTINRGVYNTAVLHDPESDAPISPTSPPAGWSRRLLWVHGFGCAGGWYYQGTSTGSLDGVHPPGPRTNTVEANFNVMKGEWLSKGYAIATSTLNHPSISCNPFLSGEAAAMGAQRYARAVRL